MAKSDKTKEEILQQAFRLASVVGLEGLTIGSLAKEVGMSKSGLFAHFQSKENLQLAVLQSAADRFVKEVLGPALKVERGLPRLKALFTNWLHWHNKCAHPGGCIFVSAASEFDDQPGAIKDFLQESQNNLLASVSQVAQTAIDEGHFSNKRSSKQFAFDFFSLLLGYHHYHRLLEDPESLSCLQTAVQDLLTRYTTLAENAYETSC